jgi:hypothetical protein
MDQKDSMEQKVSVEHKVSIKELAIHADVAPGMNVAYSCLCFGFWANAAGLTNPDGYALSMGLIQLGYFILYMVVGMYYLKHGNILSGGVYVTFAAVFGLFGGLGNIGSTIAAMHGVPFDTGITSISYIVAGFFLLFILPCLRYSPASIFMFYLIAGVGVVAYGFAGFFATEFLNLFGGWCMGAIGLISLYLGVAGFLETAGIHLPKGKPLFKKKD